MTAQVEIVVNAATDAANDALLRTVGVLGGLSNIVTGIESAFQLAGRAFDAAVEFLTPFVDAAAESEVALSSLDVILRSTASGVGVFEETVGRLSSAGLLELHEDLATATERLEEMRDEFGNVRTYTELETLAITVQEERIASLTAQIERGTNGLTIFRDTTQLTRDALIELSEELQNTTGYSDEMVLAAETMLLRFENVNSTIFPDAIRLAADLARALGIDLPAAARMIGMALDDPEAGIGRLNSAYRIFDETQMNTIQNMAAMGDIAGAQALIMEGLTEKVGGAAEAFGDTFAGSLLIARERVDNLREVIGGPFIEVFKNLLDKFNEFMDSDAVENFEQFFTRVTELLANDVAPITALGVAFQELGGVSPIFEEIGQGLILLQSYLNSGENPFDALRRSLDDLAAAHPDSPLAGIITSIQEFLSTADTEGWDVAFGNVFDGIMDALDIPERIQALTDFLITAIGNADWTPVSNAIAGALTIVLQGSDAVIDAVDWNPIGAALGRAFGELIRGMVGDEIADAFNDSLSVTFLPEDVFAGIQDRWEQYDWSIIGRGIITGIAFGFSSAFGNFFGVALNSFNLFIQRVKDIFGIASPSSVFANIGHDIVQGLINGFDFAWGSLMDLARTSLADFAGLFGIDLSSILGGGSSGTTGTHNPGGTTTPGTGGTTTGGTVINNFYGSVTFGDMGQLGYDCPSPHPLVASSGNQLVTTGF